jgi:hypothetical protein
MDVRQRSSASKDGPAIAHCPYCAWRVAVNRGPSPQLVAAERFEQHLREAHHPRDDKPALSEVHGRSR